MEHTLPPLPYAIDALALTTARKRWSSTAKHHNAYVVSLNNLQRAPSLNR